MAKINIRYSGRPLKVMVALASEWWQNYIEY